MTGSEIVKLYADGSCSGNPGPGGWGTILSFGAHEKELSGGELDTTNNRMELRGVIAGLEALTRKCKVEVYTDSNYVVSGMKSWIAGWKANGWKTSNKKPVKNEDLWRQLDELASKHDITWNWVKGHNGHAYNERADRLAVQGTEGIKAGIRGGSVDPECTQGSNS